MVGALTGSTIQSPRSYPRILVWPCPTPVQRPRDRTGQATYLDAGKSGQQAADDPQLSGPVVSHRPGSPTLAKVWAQERLKVRATPICKGAGGHPPAGGNPPGPRPSPVGPVEWNWLVAAKRS